MIRSRLPIIATALLMTACSSQNADALAANATSDQAPMIANEAAPPTNRSPVSTPAAGPVDIPQGAPTIDKTNQTGVPILKEILTKVGQFDGKSVLDFKQPSRCTSAFVTAAGTSTIDWTKVGNWAPREQGGRTSIDIDDGTGSHAISVPTAKQSEPLGDAAGDLEAGLVVISESCSARN